MALVIGIFALTLVVVMGTYWVLVVAPERQSDRALQQRLGPEHKLIRPALVRGERRMSAFPWLDAVLTRFETLARPLQRLVDRAALPVTPGAVVLACIFLGLVTYTGLSYVTVPVVSVLLALLVVPLPLLYIGRRGRRRIERFEDQFPAAIDLVSRALRAGHALPTALEMVAQEVPDPVGTEFRLLFERQNFGMSLEQALRGFAERVPLVDARFFVTAVLTQREVGGNLSEILDNLANVIRERFGVRREIRIASAHGRITGWVLGAMPPILAVILFFISRAHMRLLVEDPLGVQMVAVAVILQIIGVLFIRKIINVEY